MDRLIHINTFEEQPGKGNSECLGSRIHPNFPKPEPPSPLSKLNRRVLGRTIVDFSKVTSYSIGIDEPPSSPPPEEG